MLLQKMSISMTIKHSINSYLPSGHFDDNAAHTPDVSGSTITSTSIKGNNFRCHIRDCPPESGYFPTHCLRWVDKLH